MPISARRIKRCFRPFPGRVNYLINNTVSNLYGGNAGQAYQAIQAFFDVCRAAIARYETPKLDLRLLKQQKLVPAAILRELHKVSEQVDELLGEAGSLSEKVGDINRAHDVSTRLPTVMQELSSAVRRYQAAQKDLDETLATVMKASGQAELELSKLVLVREQADDALRLANTAYSAATTVGLGKAFSERAVQLSSQTIMLGVVLVFALAAGATITFLRVEFAHTLMLKPNVNYQILWLNVTYTALSVSAPVWLAWLLTRQIGQRFRLAEDYGYKAAVAKAYEGYRSEATQIDPELSKRLFATAIEILGEQPLRLVEKESPGSPAHDISVKANRVIPEPLKRAIGRPSRRRAATAPIDAEEA